MLRFHKTFVILWAISSAWVLLPVSVDENTAYDKKSNNQIYTIQNEEAEEYKIHGVDAEPFYMQTINDGSCGTNKGRTCGRLWLKDGVELDREEQSEYTITGKL